MAVEAVVEAVENGRDALVKREQKRVLLIGGIETAEEEEEKKDLRGW